MFFEESVMLPQGVGNWVERFRVLLEKCNAVAYHDQRLGGHTGRGLYALLVWENPEGDGIGDTSDFARRVTQLGADYRIINPTKINP